MNKIWTTIIAIVLIACGAMYFAILHNISSAKNIQTPTKVETVNNQKKLDDKPKNNSDSPIGQKVAVKNENIKIPILMYHHIRDYNDPNDKIGTNLSVPVQKFGQELDLIKQNGYTSITFDNIKQGNIPKKPIVITFDDGYDNFYLNAYPELKQRNLTAVSFVIAGKNGGDYMNNQQIKELSDAGFEIGSHTVTHLDLSTASHEKALQEITESKKLLEAITGKEIISFCYPSGKYNDDVVNIVKNAGYQFATTTHPGIGDFNTPYVLSRYRVNADTNISSYLK